MWNLWYLFIADFIFFIGSFVTWIILYKKDVDEWILWLVGVPALITGITFFVLSVCCPVMYFETKKEYSQFLYNREMIEETYKNSKELDKVGITNKIIETNDWLSKAKASKKNLGNWSVYSIIDNLDKIEYIKIEKED